MANSKVSICNIALAHLGETAIRSLTEENKRARMCDTFFESERDYLLRKFDWPFARKFAKLQSIDTEGLDVPENTHAFKIPSDCSAVRDLHPPGSKNPWRVAGTHLYVETTVASAEIYYTAKAPDVSLFSDTFVSLLAMGIASKICVPITGDKALAKELRADYRFEQNESWEADANEGNEYRAYDESPEHDTFVYPDGNYPSTGNI